MGLRQRFLELLARGEPAVVDPNAPVELDVVPLAQGPMLVMLLQQEDIQAEGIEAFDIVTKTRSRMRIMVRRSDLAAARQILERVT